MRKKSFLFALTVFLNTPSHAETSHTVSVNAGKQKAVTCISCHGENGNSTISLFPKLAQQHAGYLIKQLKAFKSGERQDSMMNTIAMTINEQDIEDIANYFADQKMTSEPDPLESKDEKEQIERQNLIAQGSDLYRNGDLKREVSACIACHGPSAEGNKPASFPYLKAQHADYLTKTLNDFKSGKRANNPENMMHMIAGKMSEEQIKAVALRISTMK